MECTAPRLQRGLQALLQRRVMVESGKPDSSGQWHVAVLDMPDQYIVQAGAINQTMVSAMFEKAFAPVTVSEIA